MMYDRQFVNFDLSPSPKMDIGKFQKYEDKESSNDERVYKKPLLDLELLDMLDEIEVNK